MTTDPLFDGRTAAELRAGYGVKWGRVADDVLPAWVADMDFPVPPVVVEALDHAVRHGALGYPDWPGGNPLRAAFAARMGARYDWRPSADEVREHTDLIQGLQLTLHLATSPGDGVLVQTPNYPPFLATITTMGRRRAESPWLRTPDGWAPDFAGLDRAARDCRVLLLVNPHNPTGRVLTRDELGEFAAIARRHDLLVVSDEIHAELAHHPHEHVPFASVSEDAARRTVTLTSATKAFNLAGLRCSVAHYGPERLLALRDAQPPDLYGVVSTLGVVGTLAAWEEGDDWQRRLLRVLDRNRRRTAAALAAWGGAEPLPEAGYLYWFPAALLGVTGDDPVAEVLDRTRVLLDGGAGFGGGGHRHLRLNFATGAPVLEEVLTRLSAAVAR
ncbi:MalY/PatB family protein [Actinosynnema sp. NPDC053489]|uniref:MalY/PatB family protein n=1 Tax=Actinosynnema sp. NPDC053489 TaxID=3363916 RepID=UPI0037C55F47